MGGGERGWLAPRRGERWGGEWGQDRLACPRARPARGGVTRAIRRAGRNPARVYRRIFIIGGSFLLSNPKCYVPASISVSGGREWEGGIEREREKGDGARARARAWDFPHAPRLLCSVECRPIAQAEAAAP